MLVTIRVYRERFAKECRPAHATVRRWIETGQPPYHAEQIGKTWYIDLSRKVTGDELVDRVLNG